MCELNDERIKAKWYLKMDLHRAEEKKCWCFYGIRNSNLLDFVSWKCKEKTHSTIEIVIEIDCLFVLFCSWIHSISLMLTANLRSQLKFHLSNIYMYTIHYTHAHANYTLFWLSKNFSTKWEEDICVEAAWHVNRTTLTDWLMYRVTPMWIGNACLVVWYT